MPDINPFYFYYLSIIKTYKKYSLYDFERFEVDSFGEALFQQIRDVCRNYILFFYFCEMVPKNEQPIRWTEQQKLKHVFNPSNL